MVYFWAAAFVLATVASLGMAHDDASCVHLVVKSVCQAAGRSPLDTLRSSPGVRNVQLLGRDTYLIHYDARNEYSQTRLMHQQGLSDIGDTLGPCFSVTKSELDHHVSLELMSAMKSCPRASTSLATDVIPPPPHVSSTLEVVLEGTASLHTVMDAFSVYMAHLNTSGSFRTSCELTIDAPQHPSWSRRFQSASVFREGHFRVTLRSGLCNCTEAVLFLGGAGYLGIRFVDLAPSFAPQNSVATETLQSETSSSRPVWSHGLTGGGEVVGVADTGLDYDSCFFDDSSNAVAFHPNTNPKHRKVLTYVECEENGIKEHGDIANAHGTHVAGSLAGHSIGGRGEYDGMAKDAKLVFHDLTCGKDQSILVPPDIGDFYDVSYKLGVRLQSNSWGGVASQTYSFTDRSSDVFLYEHQDMLAVFAAGNVANAGVIIPGSGKNILSVAAHHNSKYSNERDQAASFSARGPTYDGRSKPDLAAPGQSVTSARSDGNLNSHNCEVQAKSGTSMATPLVSGSGVLMRQYFGKGFYPSGSASAPDQVSNISGPLVKALLIHSTKGSGYNTAMGFGRLQLERVMRFDSTASDLSLHDYKIMPNGGTHEYCFGSSGGEEGVVTLVWHDSALAAEGTKDMPIVNDLDLSVVAEDGTMVKGNQNSAGGSWDRKNNVEQIRFGGSKYKKFKVVIHGFNVQDAARYGGQPYALVVSMGGLAAKDTGQCHSFTCPSSCSGKGSCVNGACVCDSTHHHVDCGQCNGTAACHGRGTCDLSGTCSCLAHVDTSGPEGKSCTTCAAGWFGPLCDFDCGCTQGVCDNDAGRCLCGNTEEGKCWEGRKCDQCCVDHGGSDCSEPSYWCHPKKIRRINITRSNPSALIQINGRGSYNNGDSCHWELVVVEEGGSDVSLSVAGFFSVERPYDWLDVVDASGKSTKFNGQYSTNHLLAKSASLTLNFFADLMQNDKGFELRYTVAFPSAPPTSPLPSTTAGSTTTTASTQPTSTTTTEPPVTPRPTKAPLVCTPDPSYCSSPHSRPSCLLGSSSEGLTSFACDCETTAATYRGEDTCPPDAPGNTARLLSGGRPYVIQFLNDMAVGSDDGEVGAVIGVITAGLLIGIAVAQLFNRKLFGRGTPDEAV